MKKKLFALLFALPLLLGGCLRNNGLCYCKEPLDLDGNGYCDTCGKPIPGAEAHEHIDTTGNGKCDICGIDMPLPPDTPKQPCKDGEHVDKDLDGRCDVCGYVMGTPAHTHTDVNPHDNHCDICGAVMEDCVNHIDQNHDGYCDVCGAKMPMPEGDVTVYLVLSSVGLYKGNKGVTVSEMFLENTVIYKAPAGSALPGKEDVTHMYGSAEFSCWYAYEGLGAPTVYTTVPSYNDVVLYANFVANGNTPTPPTPDPGPDPVDSETFYLNTSFSTGNWSKDDPKIAMYCWNDTGTTRMYTMTKVSDSQYKVDIAKNTYTGCLFLRMAQDSTFNPVNWDDSALWNKTNDLAIGTSRTAQMQTWNLCEWAS